MVDVLVLVAGEFDTQTDPTEWWRITAGEVVPESTSENPALQISAGERVTVTGPTAADIDCCEQNVCNPGSNSSCNTGGGCAGSGEKHRMQWAHTGCSDASHHIKIRVDTGGGFTDVEDNISCNAAEPDSGCCEVIGGSCTEEGIWMRTLFRDPDADQDYTYRAQIELDSTHTIVGNPCDATGCVNCGGTNECFE